MRNQSSNGHGWKSRKVWMTVFGYVSVVIGFVFAFIYGSAEVASLSLIAAGLLTGAYNLANTLQARGFAENGKDEDRGQGHA